MEVVSWNLDGIRSACEKGMADWFESRKPEILCLQEVKASKEELPDELRKFEQEGYSIFWNQSDRKGHSGVAVFTRKEPLSCRRKLLNGVHGDDGRVLVMEFEDFKLLNLYIYHGGRDKSQIDEKKQMYSELLDFLEGQDKPVIICGDFNVAHSSIDVERADQNEGNAMFTIEERKQLDQILDKGYLDAYRYLAGNESEYTWWPYAYNARERDIGWRLDYFFVPDQLEERLEDAFILTDIEGSDHCPVGIEIRI